MTRKSSAPSSGVWEELSADAAAIAEEYREEGWEVHLTRPGDVVPATKEDRFGLSVLVPGSDYEAVEEAVTREGAAFGGAEVFLRSIGSTTVAVVVERDEENETAVIVPIWYSFPQASEVFETASEEGELRIHVRPLSLENWVTFTHDDPSLFVDEDE